MLSTLRWVGNAANANSLADPNATFDPTLPCASGEDAARDALVFADAPKNLVARLEKKPQRIGPDCLFENAESILRFYEEDIVAHVVMQEVKDKRVYKLERVMVYMNTLAYPKVGHWCVRKRVLVIKKGKNESKIIL